MLPQLDIQVCTGIEGITVIKPYLIDCKISCTAETVGNDQRHKVITVGIGIQDIIFFFDIRIERIIIKRTFSCTVKGNTVDSHFSDRIGNYLTCRRIFRKSCQIIVIHTVNQVNIKCVFVTVLYDMLFARTVMVIRFDFERNFFHFRKSCADIPVKVNAVIDNTDTGILESQIGKPSACYGGVAGYFLYGIVTVISAISVSAVFVNCLIDTCKPLIFCRFFLLPCHCFIAIVYLCHIYHIGTHSGISRNRINIIAVS